MENLDFQKQLFKKFFSFFQIIIGTATLIWMFSWEKDWKKNDFQNFLSEETEEVILRNQKQQSDLVEERIFQGGEAEIIALANQARRENGLKELSRNEKLSRSAQAKAWDMKNKNYFQHVSPEGVQPWFFAEKENYRYKSFGENLAEGFFSAEETHLAWMNSDGHRKNILSENFSEIGVGIVDFQQNGMKSYLIVQHFGTEFSEEELTPQVVCKKESRQDCQDAEKKMDEVKKTMEKQEDIIDDAKDAGATEAELSEAEDNLIKLRKIKKDLKKYLAQCEEFMAQCDKWE